MSAGDGDPGLGEQHGARAEPLRPNAEPALSHEGDAEVATLFAIGIVVRLVRRVVEAADREVRGVEEGRGAVHSIVRLPGFN